MFKNTKKKMANCKKVNIFAFYVLPLICTVTPFFGCSESLQTHPKSINDLAPQALKIIQYGLADNSPRIRAKAIEVAADTRHLKLMPQVQKLLTDKFVPVRFSAALAIGELKYHHAKSSLKQLLKDQNENVRIAAAYAMSRLGHPENLNLVRKAITSDDQTIRANAVTILGKTRDKNALKLLYWALRNKNSDDKVRFQAVEAIARHGDEQIYPKLWTMLISVYADDRIMGIRAMGTLGTIHAKNALITMLDDDVLEVRLVAAEQLGMLQDTIGELEVLDVFTQSTLTAELDREGLERVRVLTALAIGRIGTPSITKFLPRLLKDDSKLVRIAAAKAVFQHIMKN